MDQRDSLGSLWPTQPEITVKVTGRQISANYNEERIFEEFS